MKIKQKILLPALGYAGLILLVVVTRPTAFRSWLKKRRYR